MAWNFRDFTHRKGNVNRFEIWSYSSTSGDDYCKVTTFCQTEAGVKWATEVLYNISMSMIKSPDFRSDFNLTTKKSSKSGMNHGRIEVAAIFNLSPEAMMAAMVNVGLPPEAEKVTIEPGALSVGPCAYRDENGTYAKVRFNGFSIPFYFNKEGFVLVPTEKAITHQVGGANAEAVFKVLVDNKVMLHKRAITRPLNLSNIGEYAKHNLKILIGDGNGRYYSATKEEMAVPNANLATVFSYDYYDTFAVIDEKVYRVNGFISGYNLGNHNMKEDDCLSKGLYNLDYQYGSKTHKGYLRFKDCVPLDEEDMFVREKIERSIQAKL